MSYSKQPILDSVLSRIYEQTFGYLDHEDDKQERSANDALLLLSANYRCTNNFYFLAKIDEIWQSVNGREEKWTDDLWYPALVMFAYSKKDIEKEDAVKVLKNFMKLWSKNNTGVAKNVTITNIIALKKGLVASGVHLSHDSTFGFLVKGCPIVHGLGAETTTEHLARIVEDLVSNLQHHIPLSPPEDMLFEANNYFILKHLKACQLDLANDIQNLDHQLDNLERSNRVQEAIMRQVTAHHDSDGIMRELAILPSTEWEAMRGIQVQIVRKFAQIVRTRFFARYPTAMLFTDIDEQISKHGIDVADLVEQSNKGVTGIVERHTDDKSDGDSDDYSPDGWESDEDGDQEFESDSENGTEGSVHQESVEPEDGQENATVNEGEEISEQVLASIVDMVAGGIEQGQEQNSSSMRED